MTLARTRGSFRLACVLVVLASCLVATIGRADFDGITYPPSTLAAIVAEHLHQPPSDFDVEGMSIKHAVLVRYAGDFRKLTPHERQFLVHWGKTWGHDPSIPAMFRRAVKVSERGTEHWLPVQDSLVKGLRKDARPGDELRLFVMFLGAAGGTPMFAINAFMTPAEMEAEARGAR